MESVPEYIPEYAPCALIEEKSGEGEVVDGAEEYRQQWRHRKSWILLVELVVKGPLTSALWEILVWCKGNRKVKLNWI